MTPVNISKTGTGRSAIAAIDSMTNPVNVGIAIVVDGTATFNIETSMEDPVLGTPTVWSIPASLSGLTASAVVALTIPCHAVSINVTAGTGTVSASIVQAGVR